MAIRLDGPLPLSYSLDLKTFARPQSRNHFVIDVSLMNRAFAGDYLHIGLRVGGDDDRFQLHVLGPLSLINDCRWMLAVSTFGHVCVSKEACVLHNGINGSYNIRRHSCRDNCFSSVQRSFAQAACPSCLEFTTSYIHRWSEHLCTSFKFIPLQKVLSISITTPWPAIRLISWHTACF